MPVQSELLLRKVSGGVVDQVEVGEQGGERALHWGQGLNGILGLETGKF